MKRYLPVFWLLLLSITTYSQNLPDNRKTDWSICGHEGDLPCTSVLRNAVTEFGIDKTGSSDVSAAINSALNAINTGEALYFPSGTYLLLNEVNVPSDKIIRGESPTSTIFNVNFASGGTAFKVYGTGPTGASSAITAVGAFGEYTFTIANTAGFNVGDDIEILQANDPAIHGAEDPGDLQSWAENLKGQFAVIKAINGNVITLDRSLVFEYDINFAMTVKKHNLASNVGLENFKMVRLSDNGIGATNNNITFAYTKNCWMRRVHLEYSSRYHVRIEFSRNFEAQECFIDKAYDCGGGGAGYGFLIQDHVTESLFENNIANALRHPWIPKEGAARNVYAYNFSNGTTQGVNCDANPLTDSYADISLHGHYPAYNLFEGNIVYRIASSDSWGPNGPGNTFLRNRVLGQKAIWIQSYSKFQNVIGNELTHPNAQFEMDRDNTIGGTTLAYSNYDTKGLVGIAAPNVVENSYYLSAKPDYFGSSAWPSIGPGVAFNTGTIPAQLRFLSGNYFESGPICSNCPAPNLGPDVSLCGKTSISLASNISAISYKWYRNGNEVGTTPAISVTLPGIYKLEITDHAGCTNSDEIIVSDILPTLNLGPDIELCSTSEITLNSNIIDNSFTYTWYKDNQIIANATTSDYKVYAAGTYKVKVEAQGCTAEIDEVVVSSKLLNVENDTICVAGVAILKVKDAGTYNWYDSQNIFLQKGTSLTVNTTNTNTYYVEDANGFSGYLGMKAPTIANSKAWTDNRFDRKLKFDVIQKLTLDSISIYSESATTVVVRILASDNSTVVFTKTFTGILADIETRLGLGIELTTGSYYLDFVGSNGELYYSNENDLSIKYPYTLDSYISITGADPAWVTAKPYYMFAYNWKVTAGNACAKTIVKAVVDPNWENCTITALPEIENAGIRPFPNPTKGKIYLGQEKNYKIINNLGLTIQEGKAQEIDLGNETAGVYMLLIDQKIYKLIKE